MINKRRCVAADNCSTCDDGLCDVLSSAAFLLFRA